MNSDPNSQTTQYLTSTETYAKQIEAQIAYYSEVTDALTPKYAKLIDDCLAIGNSEAYDCLVQLFHSDVFIDNYLAKTEFLYMEILISIYEKELTSKISVPVLTLGRSMEKLIAVTLQLKFILWRFKFSNEEDARFALSEFISSTSASPFFIQDLVKRILPNDIDTIMKLVIFFLDNNMYIHVYHLLLYIQELEPDNIEISKLLNQVADIIRKEN